MDTSGRKAAAALTPRAEDIELAFVRMLSVNGRVLAGSLSAADKRERIRVAILQMGLLHKIFQGSETFAEAFERCYQMAVDQRRFPRDALGRPVNRGPLPEDEDELADEDD